MARLSQLLVSRDRRYFDLFEEAGGNIVRAADLLDQLLRAYPERREELTRDILICEQEGDRITHDIIRRLNETFVTPIDREDIYALASALDDIVDYTEEAADYLGLYKIEAPMEQAQRLAHVLLQSARAVSDAIPRLRSFGTSTCERRAMRRLLLGRLRLDATRAGGCPDGRRQCIRGLGARCGARGQVTKAACEMRRAIVSPKPGRRSRAASLLSSWS